MSQGKCSISADFLEHPSRPLFHVLLQPAAVEPCGAILFCPPFADEMHMSRHIVAASARALAASGYCVLLPDLYGCGDAPGEFADATWSVWREDLQHALLALRQRFELPVTLWGLRAGCLLAAQIAHDDEAVSRLLMWQPVLNGEQQIDQFLRLQTAASALLPTQTFNRKALWGALREGQVLEVAGYSLAPALAMEMSEVRLATLSPRCDVQWLDISPGGLPVPASANVLSRWREAGVTVAHEAMHGEPFWRTIEAPSNPLLSQRTLAMLESSL